MNQKTIGRVIKFEGPSIISDEISYISILPASPNSGIRFSRLDCSALVSCHPSNLCRKRFTKWTSLQENGVRIEAIEHLLAALSGMGITNATIELQGDGIPLVDCSALPFVKCIQDVGVIDQGVAHAPKFFLSGQHTVWEEMVDFKTGRRQLRLSYLTAIPQRSGLHISYLLHYDKTGLGMQLVETEITPETFAKDIAPARTFMTPWELERWAPDGPEPLLSQYFCDVVPIVSTINVFEERIPNEAASHKILDMMGDLAVLGLLSGTFFGVRSGHSLNKAMVRRIRSGG